MGVFALIKEDFSVAYNNDPASQSKIDLMFSYPGVWALFWHRLSHPLFKRGFKRLARFLMRRLMRTVILPEYNMPAAWSATGIVG